MDLLETLEYAAAGVERFMDYMLDAMVYTVELIRSKDRKVPIVPVCGWPLHHPKCRCTMPLPPNELDLEKLLAVQLQLLLSSYYGQSIGVSVSKNAVFQAIDVVLSVANQTRLVMLKGALTSYFTDNTVQEYLKDEVLFAGFLLLDLHTDAD